MLNSKQIAAELRLNGPNTSADIVIRKQLRIQLRLHS